MKSLATRLILAVLLLVALPGYFFDLECMVNRCETAASSSHGECLSPVVIPDSHPPAEVAEFFLLSSLLTIITPPRQAQEIPETPGVCWSPHPPPEQAAHSRRGPPVSS